MSGTITINLVPPIQSITPGLGRRGTGPFADWPLDDLQRVIREAQSALIKCLTGALVQVVSYAEGQGHRQVTYSRVNPDQLRQLIAEMRAGLGVQTRGSVWPRFG
jgi:hypothetical protein